ncbi:MAG: glycosyltransferase family 2 protein [Gemmataceae bacterium]
MTSPRTQRSRRPRPIDQREMLHQLNQRYYQQWHRAERLERELARVRGRLLGPLFAWLLALKRRFIPLPQHAAETTLPTGTPLAEPTQTPAGTLSIIIPFKDNVDLLRACLRSLRRTTRDGVEFVLVDTGSQDPRTARYLARLQLRPNVRLVACPGPFNFSRACNLGASQATGDFFLFLNNDTEALAPDWRDRMLRLLADPTVGVVGGLLLYPDHTIQHAGIFPDDQGRWVHVGRTQSPDSLTQPMIVPAVSGACLLLRRADFTSVAGFDETLPLTYNDVDLCRRLADRGLRTALAPAARFFHYEGLTRGFSGDQPGADHLHDLTAFPA